MLRREYRGVPLPSSATHLLVLVADLAKSEAENRGEEHPHESAHQAEGGDAKGARAGGGDEATRTGGGALGGHEHIGCNAS